MALHAKNHGYAIFVKNADRAGRVWPGCRLGMAGRAGKCWPGTAKHSTPPTSILLTFLRARGPETPVLV